MRSPSIIGLVAILLALWVQAVDATTLTVPQSEVETAASLYLGTLLQVINSHLTLPDASGRYRWGPVPPVEWTLRNFSLLDISDDGMAVRVTSGQDGVPVVAVSLNGVDVTMSGNWQYAQRFWPYLSGSGQALVSVTVSGSVSVGVGVGVGVAMGGAHTPGPMHIQSTTCNISVSNVKIRASGMGGTLFKVLERSLKSRVATGLEQSIEAFLEARAPGILDVPLRLVHNAALVSRIDGTYSSGPTYSWNRGLRMQYPSVPGGSPSAEGADRPWEGQGLSVHWGKAHVAQTVDWAGTVISTQEADSTGYIRSVFLREGSEAPVVTIVVVTGSTEQEVSCMLEMHAGLSPDGASTVVTLGLSPEVLDSGRPDLAPVISLVADSLGACTVALPLSDLSVTWRDGVFVQGDWDPSTLLHETQMAGLAYASILPLVKRVQATR
ncbi:hypothetical protein KIPB_005975 [Kipferlia bialata]|uniref:Lipid-binding serum glycoprotein N-terminal domain-containing protein n=1 Tax=Kipferlia bialata TaxID=797122 RepID=A0A9K3GHU7_9EUKA|nr:hypothetical protein KIPB_005975 [Kipferlia bialata]|eukprot:g5975.t1